MALDGMEGVDLAKWTQVIIGAAMGAFIAVMFRRPAGWLDWLGLFGSAFFIGALAAEWVAAWLTLPLYQAAGLSGALGFSVYQGVRKGLETFDFAAWFTRKELP